MLLPRQGGQLLGEGHDLWGTGSTGQGHAQERGEDVRSAWGNLAIRIAHLLCTIYTVVFYISETKILVENGFPFVIVSVVKFATIVRISREELHHHSN